MLRMPPTTRFINPTNMSEDEMKHTALVLLSNSHIIGGEIAYTPYLRPSLFTNTILKNESDYFVLGDSKEIIGFITIENQRAIYSGRKYQGSEEFNRRVPQGIQDISQEVNLNPDNQEFENPDLKNKKMTFDFRKLNYLLLFPLRTFRTLKRHKRTFDLKSEDSSSSAYYENDPVDAKGRFELEKFKLENDHLNDLQKLKTSALKIIFEIKSNHNKFLKVSILSELNILKENSLPNVIKKIDELMHDISTGNSIHYSYELENINLEFEKIKEIWIKHKLINILDEMFYSDKFKNFFNNELCTSLVINLQNAISECDFFDKQTEEIFKLLGNFIEDFTVSLRINSQNGDVPGEVISECEFFSKDILDYLSDEYALYSPKAAASSVRMKM